LTSILVLYLGDLGNPLTEEQLARLRGRVDVLLALARRPSTVELEDLDRAIEEIKPDIVIPMHYQIPKIGLNILPLEAFTSRYPEDAVTRVGDTEIQLHPGALPRAFQTCVLEPSSTALRRDEEEIVID
jgi:hypothetical protein